MGPFQSQQRPSFRLTFLHPQFSCGLADDGLNRDLKCAARVSYFQIVPGHEPALLRELRQWIAWLNSFGMITRLNLERGIRQRGIVPRDETAGGLSKCHNVLLCSGTLCLS